MEKGLLVSTGSRASSRYSASSLRLTEARMRELGSPRLCAWKGRVGDSWKREYLKRGILGLEILGVHAEASIRLQIAFRAVGD
jgi:hypothetical protein